MLDVKYIARGGRVLKYKGVVGGISEVVAPAPQASPTYRAPLDSIRHAYGDSMAGFTGGVVIIVVGVKGTFARKGRHTWEIWSTGESDRSQITDHR